MCVFMCCTNAVLTALCSWLLILSDCCRLRAVGAQEYLKLSDVYKMYGSSRHRDSGEPASRSRLLAVDAALAGISEVPSLPVCLCPDWFLS